MASYRIISSDSHIFEPPDLWAERVEPRYRERAPRIVRGEDGDWWFCDGVKTNTAGAGAQAGRRFEEPEKLSFSDFMENVRPGGYIPDEHVKDMDIDGIDAGILYPTEGLQLFGVPDGELLNVVFRAYNDWIAEFCSSYPKRLHGIAMLNVDDVTGAIGELERCARLGLRGAMITVYPPENRSYDSPEYESLWAAAQDHEMPLSLHLGTTRATPARPYLGMMGAKPSDRANTDHWVRMSLSDMIYSGVFERYPRLRVGAIELELAWVPHFLQSLDYTYTQRPPGDVWPRFEAGMLPSDYFHRNVFVSFQEDALGIRLREIIGVDNLMWGSDYPHFESTFPRSQQVLEEILDGCTNDDRAAIAGSNAARVYKI